jgi:type I restriction enzyme, S subunit
LSAKETLGDYFVERKESGRPDLPIYSVTIEKGLICRSRLDRRTESALSSEAHLLVKPGDIAYNMMRMWQGALGVCSETCMVSPAYVVMRPRANVDPAFAAIWMKSHRGLDRLWAYSHGITEDRLRLYADDFLSIPVSFPSKEEQQRIAALLNVWDDAIMIAERLADTKAKRFRALVQRLIVGSAARLDELSNIADLVNAKRYVQDGHFSASVELDDVESFSGRLLGMTPAQGLSGQRVCFQEGDTLFAKLRPYLRKAVFARQAGMASTEMWVFRAKPNKCLPLYLHYLIRSPLFHAQAERPTGSRMPRADWEWVQETPLPRPELNEQGRIAKVLSAAEEDARATLRSLDLIRRQKRGLMQKLLTKEWHLPERGDPFMPGSPAVHQLEAAE